METLPTISLSQVPQHDFNQGTTHVTEDPSWVHCAIAKRTVAVVVGRSISLPLETYRKHVSDAFKHANGVPVVLYNSPYESGSTRDFLIQAKTSSGSKQDYTDAKEQSAQANYFMGLAIKSDQLKTSQSLEELLKELGEEESWVDEDEEVFWHAAKLGSLALGSSLIYFIVNRKYPS